MNSLRSMFHRCQQFLNDDAKVLDTTDTLRLLLRLLLDLAEVVTWAPDCLVQVLRDAFVIRALVVIV